MSFTDPRATLPWGLHDPTAFPDDDDNRGCLKRLTSAYEALAVARYGLVGSLWEVPAVNSALQCLAAAAPCKDVKIYPSCIFQVHAPMFVTIKTSLRCLNPHDLCLCLICVGCGYPRYTPPMRPP